MSRVVVTGLGAVTPLGPTMEASWQALLAGRSGIAALSDPEYEGLRVRIGGPVKDFRPEDHLDPKEILRWDPFVHYAVAAVGMALQDAGLDLREVSGNTRVGIILGTSRGGIRSLSHAADRDCSTRQDRSGRAFSAYLMSSSTPYMAAAACAMKAGIRGPSLGVSTACTSGAHAIGEAFSWIRNGVCDIVVAGGSDAALCRLAIGGYDASGALSRRNESPTEASRPFDRDRDGFVISDGAAALVLERADRVAARGAAVYGEVAGYGSTTSALHETRPDPASAAQAIRLALEQGGVSASDIGFVHAHGTSTKLGDAAEAEVLRSVLGRVSSRIAVTATKSMTGHLLGAAGALDAVFALRALRESRVPPVLNFSAPDPDSDLNLVLGGPAIIEAEWALSNTFGFGGGNVSLLFRRS